MKRMIKNISLTLMLVISLCFYVYIVDSLNDLGKIVAFMVFVAIIIIWSLFCDWSKVFDIDDNE